MLPCNGEGIVPPTFRDIGYEYSEADRVAPAMLDLAASDPKLKSATLLFGNGGQLKISRVEADGFIDGMRTYHGQPREAPRINAKTARCFELGVIYARERRRRSPKK